MDCCGSDGPVKPGGAKDETTTDGVRDQVREGYARIAEAGSLSAETGGGCCGDGGWSAEQLAERVGYSSEEIATLPEGANMGLSCGNPTAIAGLQPGQVVLDLGSGGGFDCFLAGPKVGAEGRVIGVDMTPEMLSKARGNLDAYRRHSGLDNVEFRLGEIEHLPAADRSVDVVISNCVINLSPDKQRVWEEIARILAPGGRVAVSDLALHRPLPEDVKEMTEALVGCIAGAALIEDHRRMMEAAGLTGIELTPRSDYVDALRGMDDPLYRKIADRLPEGTSLADYVTSLDIQAKAPSADQPCCGGA